MEGLEGILKTTEPWIGWVGRDFKDHRIVEMEGALKTTQFQPLLWA